jgi:Na+-driven multidrug efflux pump
MRFSFMPAHGVGIALSAIVGKAIGEGDATRAERMTRISVLIMLAYMGTLSILYFIFRVPMIAWFNEEPAVVAIGSSVILCTAVFQLFDALMIGYIYALRGAGDTAWPAWFSCISHWIFIAGGGFLMVTFAPQLGSIGPWMAATALIMFIGVAVRFRWKSGVWKTVDLFERGDQPATAKPATDCADTVNVKATSNEILVSAEYAEDFGTFSRLDT